jgi:dolichol-phosphate mannosyltransferase
MTDEGTRAMEGEIATIVIPAYNEEERIVPLLAQMPRFGFRYIFVCDGTDDTPRRVAEFAREHPEAGVVCLRFRERLGKGGAILSGLEYVQTKLAGYMDADAAVDLGEMTKLFAKLDGADAAIGSRWVDGARIPVRQGVLRRIQSRTFNRLVRLLYSLPFRDTQCGAKAFRMSALSPVLPEIRSRGFEFDVELLWRLHRRSATIREVPVVWQERGGSRVRQTDWVAMLWRLISLRSGG